MQRAKGVSVVAIFACVGCIAWLLKASSEAVAAPVVMAYQGELRSPVNNEPVPDGQYDMLFVIYNLQVGGSIVWQGTHTHANGNPVDVKSGVFSVVLGTGPGNELDATAFSGGGERWLGVAVGLELLKPRQRITAVPYAVQSQDAKLLGGKYPTDFALAGHSHAGEAWPAAEVALSLQADRTGLDVSARRLSHDFAPVKGLAVEVGNAGSGDAYGGHFFVEEGGTGGHYGVYSWSEGNTGYNAFGVYSIGQHTGSGAAYGGYFRANLVGNGPKCGVRAKCEGEGHWAGYFEGNLGVSGDLIVNGQKNAAVRTLDGRDVTVSSIESPGVWLEDFGSAQLSVGTTLVEIEPTFRQVANTIQDYHVFVTPEGDCNGLYVSEKSDGSFRVSELRKGTSSVVFSYRIVAKRRGYETEYFRAAPAGLPEIPLDSLP